jgi:hypothetical protein
MIVLEKQDTVPTNTTLTKIDNNLSPLENAAGVTLIEVEELEKKESDDATKVPTNSTVEAKPSTSTKLQTGQESAGQISLEDNKEKRPDSKDLTTTGAAV